MYKNLKNFIKLICLGLVAPLLISCNSEDWIPVELNSFNCYVNNPLCYQGEGELVVNNTDTTQTITEIYITENCAAGWGSPITASIQPQQTQTYDLEASTEYDIKLVGGSGLCAYHYDKEIKPNKQKIIYSTVSGGTVLTCQNTAC